MRRNLLLCSIIAMMTACIMACGSDKQPEEPGTADMGVQEEYSTLGKESGEALEAALVSEAEPEEDQKQPEETQENAVEQEEVENEFPPQATNPDEEIFIRFLNNEIEAVFSDSFQDDLRYACRVLVIGDEDDYTFSGKESLTYEELKAAVDASESNFLDISEEERYYAFLSTIDGGEVFAVKFQNLGIYCSGDNSYAVFFFAVNDDELYVTYAYDDWARSATTIKEPLLLIGGGSSGAEHHHGWSGYIDKTGEYREIYSAEYLSNEWIAREACYRYGLDDLDQSQCEGCTLELLEMQDRKYFCYYYYDDEADEFADIEIFADFCTHLEEDGMRKIEIDDETNMIDAAYEEIGFTEAGMPFDSWIAWD
ncbi:MAG: hypothetical protein K2K17_00550 [Lachnospiraceae bacterium]|nr:hypothetical protein [Lachnospiraceae bacterium]